MNKDLQMASNSRKRLRPTSEPALGNASPDRAQNGRERVSGTLSIESFWRAIDGDNNGRR